MSDFDHDDFRRMVEAKGAENPLRILGLSPDMVEQIPTEYLVEFAQTYVNRVLARYFHPDTGKVSNVDMAKFNLALDRLRRDPATAKQELFSKYEENLAIGKQLKKELAKRKELLRGTQAMVVSASMPNDPQSLVLMDENLLGLSFEIWEIDANGFADISTCRIDYSDLMAEDYGIETIGKLYDEMESIDAIGYDMYTVAEKEQLGKLEIQLDEIDAKYHQLVDEYPDGEGLTGNELRTYNRWIKLHGEIEQIKDSTKRRQARRAELVAMIAERENTDSSNLWLHHNEQGEWVSAISPEPVRLVWFYQPDLAQWYTHVLNDSEARDKDQTEELSIEPYGMLASKAIQSAVKVLGSIKVDSQIMEASGPALGGTVDTGMNALGLVRLPAEMSEKAILSFNREFIRDNRVFCLVKMGEKAHYYYSNSTIVASSGV